MITQWQEFTKVHLHCATSAKGFRVEIDSEGWKVHHSDSTGRVSFDCEWITKPDGIVLFLDSPGNAGVAELEKSHAYKVIREIAAALRFLGFRTETDDTFPQEQAE